MVTTDCCMEKSWSFSKMFLYSTEWKKWYRLRKSKLVKQFFSFNSIDAKVYGIIITVNSYVKMPTFSWIVLCGDDVLIPDDLLGGVQRHLVELFYLGDSSLMVGHLNISEKGFMRFVSSRPAPPWTTKSSARCAMMVYPSNTADGQNVGYIPHSARGQSHPMNILKRHTSPSKLAFWNKYKCRRVFFQHSNLVCQSKWCSCVFVSLIINRAVQIPQPFWKETVTRTTLLKV